MIPTRLALPILTVLTVLAGNALRADELQLVQEYVAGFPIDDTNDIIPYVLPGEGEHRVAVLTDQHITGLQWSSQRNRYDQAFFIHGERRPLTMILADADGDGIDDVLTTHYGATAIEVRSSLTGVLMKSIPLASDDAIFASTELDGSPGTEWLLFLNDVAAYQGETLLWRAPFAAHAAATPVGGNVAGEVFVAARTEVIVLDAQSGAERRRLPLACWNVVVGQTDGDPGLEIACSSDRLLLADATTGAVQWTSPTMGKVAMVDADDDGRYDVFIRRSGYAVQDVIVLSGDAGTPLTPHRDLEWDGAVAAFDAGCESLLLAVEGSRVSMADTLYVFDPATLVPRGSYRFDDFGVKGLVIADLDRDGRNELIAHHDGSVTTATLPPYTKFAEVQRGTRCCGFRGMAVAQLDSDPGLEYVLAGDEENDGKLRAFDAMTHELMWTASTDAFEMPHGIETADLDGDVDVDVLTWVTADSGGAKGLFIYAFDGPTGQPLWRSVNLPELRGMAVADNGDGSPDVLALSASAGVVRLDGRNGAVRAFDEFESGSAFTVANIDADPTLEIVAVAGNRLFLLDDGQRLVDVPLDLGMAVTEMEVADIDSDGRSELLLARREAFSGIRLQVRALDTLAVLWTSELFPTLLNFAQHEFIQFVDVDNDGASEVTFFGSLSFRVFRVGGGSAVDTIAPRFAPGAALRTEVHSRDTCCTAVRLSWDAPESDASPPLRYEVFRSGHDSGQRALLGATARTELVDASAGGAAGYRYFVRVSDAAGNTSEEELIADVAIRAKAAHCRRRAVRR